MAQIRKGIHGMLLVCERTRPNVFKPGVRIEKTATPLAECPFCPGNEKMTPPEIDRMGGKGRKWRIRRFNNRRQSFTKRNSAVENTHQLIIPTPVHALTYSELSEDNLFAWLSMVRKATIEMERNGLVRWVDAFANEGYLAGRTVEHSHTQVIGWDFVPPLQKKYIRFASKKSGCGFCSLEGEHPGLVIVKNDDFTAFVPHDAQRYYHVEIVGPHIRSITEMPDSLLRSLAGIFKSVLGSVNSVTNFAAYNINIFSAPKGARDYHFRVEILPHASRYGGFEHTSGVVQLNISPEEMAATLRGA